MNPKRRTLFRCVDARGHVLAPPTDGVHGVKHAGDVMRRGGICTVGVIDVGVGVTTLQRDTGVVRHFFL